MRLCSIDIFDTVVTRLVAEPVDLFQICGGQLLEEGLISSAPSAFAKQRIEAEARARKSAPGLEPTFAEIQAELGRTYGWDARQSDRSAQIELAAESATLVTFPGALALVAEARKSFDEVIFLSDMYLPGTFIRNTLERLGVSLAPDRIYVSNEYRASKSEGALFEIVRRDFPKAEKWIHYGDRSHSDFRMPRQQGIEGRLVTDGQLNFREQEMRGRDATPAVWRSHFAAAMRWTRLRNPQPDSPQATIWDLGADVAGPLLCAYVAWVLEQSVARGIERLYFVSRDGEILLRIAHIFVRAWKLPVECRYLYGSRQAWHASSIQDLGDREKAWILENDIPLTPRIISDRLGIAVESVVEEFNRQAGEKVSADHVLSTEGLAAFWNVLKGDSLRQAIVESAEKRRALLLGYLDQEQVFAPGAAAIVDLGWRGNMQRSLSALPEIKNLPDPLTGFYFGFAGRAPEGEEFLSFWEHVKKELFPYRRVTFMEIFTAGREGSALSYACEDGKFLPVLNRPQNLEALEWGLPGLQESIGQFAETISRLVSLNELNLREAGEAASELFLTLCENPSTAEARTLGGFKYTADQGETKFQQMVRPDMSYGEFTQLAWRKDLWQSHSWIEGQLAIQPCWPVAAANWLRKLKKRLGR